MSDDVVAWLRLYAQKQRETKSSVLGLLLSDAADEIERLRSVVEAWKTYSSRAERDIAGLREERDEVRMRTGRILNEIDCRIEHGAESNGHLEAIRNLFNENTDGR